MEYVAMTGLKACFPGMVVFVPTAAELKTRLGGAVPGRVCPFLIKFHQIFNASLVKFS